MSNNMSTIDLEDISSTLASNEEEETAGMPQSNTTRGHHPTQSKGDNKKQDNGWIKGDSEESSIDSSEYDFVHADIEDNNGERMIVPQEHFAGTWDMAIHESAKAAKEVGKASKSYFSAVASSGIGKASFAIGGALAKTANKTALNTASYVMSASGADPSRLPSPVKTWFDGKKKMDDAKARALDAERARLARKYREVVNARKEKYGLPTLEHEQSGSRAEGVSEPVAAKEKNKAENLENNKTENMEYSMFIGATLPRTSMVKNLGSPASVRRTVKEPSKELEDGSDEE